MKILGIGGVPGVGKTTLMTHILYPFAPLMKREKHGLVEFSRYEPKLEGKRELIVLGVYGDTFAFGGTDKLSMAVQPEAEEFVRRLGDDFSSDNLTIMFEGDRLFNESFITVCKSVAEFRGVVLVAPLDELFRRRTERSKAVGKEQDETWLQGRTTKVKNVMTAHGIVTEPVSNPQQCLSLADSLRSWAYHNS